MMIACVDTQYLDSPTCAARTGLVMFEQWSDSVAAIELAIEHAGPLEDYIPGEFFKRELPCILDAVTPYLDRIETIVVDGYVHLGGDQPGLGLKLFEELNRQKVIIGVAKKRFHSADQAIEIVRGQSSRPLFVTAAGIDVDTAAENVYAMAGQFRIPTLIKRADSLARDND